VRLTRALAALLGLALLGGIVAGCYGILHDQITFSISPEYFTRMKFYQFAWADLGLPRRVFVGEIGFLATWWVGVIAASFLGAVALFLWPVGRAFREVLGGFAFVFAGGLLAGLTGGWLGRLRRRDPDFTNWQDYSAFLGVRDLPAFVHVAYIHNASYLGGVIGLAAGLLWLLSRAPRERWKLWKSR